MPPTSTTHPSAQLLSAFSQGKLTGPTAEAVARHLQTCAVCRQSVAKNPGDTSLGPGPSAGPQGTKVGAVGSTSQAGRPSAAAPSPPGLPPELAQHPRFRIVRELGQGGMGMVYQAEHRLMERSVAIKVINKSLVEHPEALARFQAEVKAAARLQDPHIVAAYDAEQAGNLHLLVMEYVEGLDLAKVLEKKGPLSVPYACHYIRQAALGLQHAFTQGMVHRDIKPQNLMLNAQGQVKILDFGLARLAHERQRGPGLTRDGVFMGTPEYVAPEQATDARKADIRADIYSLGCTLYCLLAGRPPFVEDTEVKMVLAHLEKEARPLSEVRADVPPELANIVARMLAKNPAQRFQTPIEVAQALEPFCKPGQKGTTVPVPPPSKGVAVPARGTKLGAAASPPPPRQESVSAKPAPKLAVLAEPEDSPFNDLTAPATPIPSPPTIHPQPSAQRKIILVAMIPALLVAGGLVAAAVIYLRNDSGKQTTQEHTVHRDDSEPQKATVPLRPSTPPPATSSTPPPLKGAVVLEDLPEGAEVFVNGQRFAGGIPGGQKPLRIEVGEGRQEVKVTKDGFEAFTHTVSPKAGQEIVLSVNLVPIKPTDGTVVLENVPTGAEVFVDERRIEVAITGDKKPLRIKVPEGRHDLKVTKAAYKPFAQPLTLKGGQELAVAVILDPIKRIPPPGPVKPPVTNDALQEGTVWKGRFAYRPPETTSKEMQLHITQRTKDQFRGELWHGQGSWRAKIQGNITGSEVEFRCTEVIKGEAEPWMITETFPYACTLQGKQLRDGRYEIRDKNNLLSKATFTLDLQNYASPLAGDLSEQFAQNSTWKGIAWETQKGTKQKGDSSWDVEVTVTKRDNQTFEGKYAEKNGTIVLEIKGTVNKDRVEWKITRILKGGDKAPPNLIGLAFSGPIRRDANSKEIRLTVGYILPKANSQKIFFEGKVDLKLEE